MANTFELISSVTVGSGGAASIDFTSIPATYTDLCLELSIRSSRSAVGDLVMAYFNSSASSITSKRLEGVSASSSYTASDSLATNQAGSPRFYVGACSANSATSSTFGSLTLYIPNYASSNNKSTSSEGVGENNGSDDTVGLGAGLWSNSSAITSISLGFYFTGSTFLQYSTAYLYGVKNA